MMDAAQNKAAAALSPCHKMASLIKRREQAIIEDKVITTLVNLKWSQGLEN